MNHIYRTIWNQALGVWQATSEHAAGRGKTKSSRTLKQRAAVLGLLAASPMLHGQGIVTDGRTDTTLLHSGNTTNIHTQTIQNGNGINSFSRFNVHAGDIANLHVPASANALVNIVRDQATTIDGILNSYKNGQIGGNVFFANPHGFIVGATGVINTGTLSISTPTAAFLESLLDRGGQVNPTAMQQLQAGHMPLSPSGLVAVRGQINATGALHVAAGQVVVDTGAQVVSGHQAAPRIEQLVNTQGLQSAGALVSENGDIRIVALGDVRIAGAVAADGVQGRAAGQVDVRAGGDIVVEGSGRLSASGQGQDSSGGSVVVFADQRARLGEHATVQANAGSSGDGGFVEFSAKRNVTWSGRLEAHAGAGGAAGHVLIDPATIDITTDQRLVGTHYTLQADERITVHDGVMVSTRNIADALTASHLTHRDAVSIGDSGNITLQAPIIELGAHSKLYAHTNTGAFQGGDITLQAISAQGALLTPGILIGVGGNTAAISVGAGAEIAGKRVSLTAEASTALTDALSQAQLYNSFDADGNPQVEHLTEAQKAEQQQRLRDAGVLPADSTTDAGFFPSITQALAEAGLLASVQVLEADAHIDIGAGASIIGSQDVALAAHAATTADASVKGLHIGAVVSVTDTIARLSVGQNAHIESTSGQVTLKSQSDSVVHTAVEAMQVQSSLPVTITANVTHAEGSAFTEVAEGALIKAATDVTVRAEQNKDFQISAKAGDSQGAVGAAVLVALSDLSAATRFAGTAEAGRDVTLNADVLTQANAHAASVVLGDTLGTRAAKVKEDLTQESRIERGIASVFSRLTAQADGKGGNQDTSQFLKETGLAGAMAYVDHDNAARTTVAGSAVVNAGRDATLAAGVLDALNSAVGAEVSDKRAVEKPKGLDTVEASGKKNGAAVAILVSSQNNAAELEVEDGARIDAQRDTTLQARASLPWAEQSRIAQLIQALDNTGDWDTFKDTVSKGDQLFSTWVDAATTVSGEAAQDDGSALSGMVNVNNVGLDARVRVGDGVAINQHQPADPATAQRVTIEAQVESQMVNVAADPVPTSSSGGKTGFGGSVIVGTYTHHAEVDVGAADIRANAVAVDATTDVRMINYAAAGSAGGKDAFGGAVAVALLDNTTRATVDDGARIDVSAFNGAPDDALAGDLRISATDNLDALTITGGVVSSSTKAFGVAAGANDFTRVTEAWLGSADTLAPSGHVDAAGALRVLAHSDGTVGNYAISAALTGPTPPAKPEDQKPPAPSTQAAAGDKQAGEFGLNVSGSAAVNLMNTTVRAAVRDDIDLQAGELRVQADEDTALHAIAGGAAVSNNEGSGAGLAGAYTHNTVNATVEALLETHGSVQADTLGVLADNETTLLSIAAGVSASRKSDATYQLAGSVTFNTVDAQTTARLANSDVAVVGNVDVSASDRSGITAVAGSASYGGKAGVGAGIAINDISSHTSATAQDLGALTAQGIRVNADNSSTLVSVAAAMGYSSQYAFDGAVAVNQIDNETRAAVEDATGVVASDALGVTARNGASITTVAGTVAVSGGNALGASFAYNTISDRVSAEVIGGDARAQSINIAATQDVGIDALVAGGAAGKSSSATGSVAVNTIDNHAVARTDGADLHADDDITLQAQDDSRIRVLTGALAYGGTGAGIGIAGSYNDIGGSVQAVAHGGALRADQGSVLIEAERTQQLQSLAAGAGGGGSGVAGSVAVNRVGGDTLAEVGGGADVSARQNVLVSARADSDIETVAGALAVGTSGVGLGGAVAVNDLHGDTSARIGGTGTRVSALGQGAALTVDNGEINGTESDDLRLRRLSDNVAGTAVVASSTDEINTVAASVGGSASSVGAAGAVTVNTVAGATTAEVVDGAAVNAAAHTTGAGAAAAQAVQVGAYHHTRVEHATGAAGIGGSAGIGASVGTTLVSHETQARVSESSLAAVGHIGVDARATTDLNGVVAGAAIGAGSAGAAGSVAVTTVSGQVLAEAHQAQLRSDQGNLSLSANADNEAHMIAGALAGGSAAGIGATVIVSTFEQSTVAQTTGTTALNARGQTSVEAHASQQVLHVGATAAGGGTAGVAGTVSVLTADGQTRATLGGGSTVNAALSGAQQDVVVAASDAIDTSAVLGTLGVGLAGAGVGASADVQNIRSGAVAEVGAGATVNAGRDIRVQSDNQRDVDSKAIAAGGGLYVGAAAGVSVVNVAAGASSTATSSLEGSLANTQTVARQSGINGQMGTAYSGAGQLQSDIQARQAGVDPNSRYTALPDPTAYSAAARVGAGSTLAAGGHIDITAQNTTDASSQGVGVGAGMVGAGAGVSVIDVGDRSLAALGGTATAGGRVNVLASDGQQGVTQAQAQAGGGGLVGLGAAVAVSEKTSASTAQLLDGARITAAGEVRVDAGIDHALAADTVGVAVGAAAVGASVATATSSGQARALVGDNAQVQGASVQVNAKAVSSNAVNAIGASGGALAGNAVVGTASDETLARAWVGNGAVVRATLGDIALRATTDPRAQVTALGASLGAVGAGATVALTSVDTTAQAGTGAAALFGQGLLVNAEVENTRGHSAEAQAVGATGGVLLGANATVGQASIDTEVSAEVGAGSLLSIHGDATIRTRDAANAHVHATGVAAGALAVGANHAQTTLASNQTARLGGTGVVGGVLSVRALGNNAVSGQAVAGSGGLVAGHASTLDVQATSTTRVEVAGSTDIEAGTLNLQAEHSTDYDLESDSVQASLVGASGTFIEMDFAATTELVVNSGARLSARDGMALDAHSITRGAADAFSGAGGVVSGSAILIDNTITDTSRVTLGQGVELTTHGDPLLEQPAHLTINAHNTLAVSDTARLSVGGAIAAPYAGTEMNVAVVNEALIGDNAQLTSSGLLRVGAHSQSNAATNARVDIYGLAGAGGGDTAIDFTARQRVSVGAGADLLGYGNVALNAGQSADGIESNDIQANASTVVLNNTLIPITAALGADAVARSFNDLTLGSGATVRSVRNVDLLSTNGKVQARGEAVEKNPYLALFSSERMEGSSATERKANLQLSNAGIVAGVSNRQEVFWDGSQLTVVSALGDITAAFVPAGSGAAFKPLAEIDARLADYNARLLTLTPGSAEHTTLADEIALFNQMRTSTELALGAGAGTNTAVDTLVIGDIIAGAGDIKVGADEITQAGAQLTAYGAPTVVIHNSSDDYLVTNRVLVSAPGSGKITSTGAAKVASSGATLREVGSSQSTYYDADQRPTAPSIMVVNSFDTGLPGNNSPAPGMLVLGGIENLRGSTTLRNESGNVSQFARIESKQLTVEVPNGDLFINLPGRSWGLASVQTEWANRTDAWSPEAMTGGDWARSVPESVVELAGNVLYNANGDGSPIRTDSYDLTVHLVRDNAGAAAGTGQSPVILLGSGQREYRETSADDNANWTLDYDKATSITGNVSADDHDFWTGDTGLWSWVHPDVRTLQTQHAASLGQADTSGSSASAIKVGGSLFINARNINVNAGIEVGSKTDWSVNLGGATASEIAGIGAASGLHKLNSVSSIADANDGTDGADAMPDVYWDAANRRIQVNNIQATGGGSVSLNGNIVNTNTLGRITVNSGLGDITVNNTSGHAVLLQDMDVGSGGQSVVKITDTLKTWASGANAGAAQTWWYVNQAGDNTVSVYNNTNGATSLGTAQLDSTTGRSFDYNPLAGARFEWTQSYDVSRTYSGPAMIEGDAGELPGNLSAWRSNITTADGRSHTTSEGSVVVRAVTGNDQALMQWSSANIDYTDVEVSHLPSSDWGGYGGGTVFRVATGAQLQLTNSVKADHAIPIRFVGQQAASIQVTSNADVHLGGVVNNTVGTTTVDVTGGALLQAGGSLLAQHLQLNATGGVGSAGAALNLVDSRTAQASVSASSQGDIHLAMQGDLHAQRIVTAGDITVRAEGGIYQHAAAVGASIEGAVLNLHSASASTIGSASQPLITQSQEINASAPGSILLTQASGHMNVGTIATTFGNVELNTPSGQILGAAPKADAFDSELAKKIALWEGMGVGDSQHANTTIRGFENQVEQRYADYWTIRDLAVAPDTSFQLTSAGLALFKAQAAAILGVQAPTPAQINTVMQARYQEARGFLSEAPGITSTALQARTPGFSYALATDSETHRNLSHGAVWAKSMLGGVINAGAEAGTRPTTGALPNVSAPLGSIRLNNDPTQPLPDSEQLVFTMQATNGYVPVVTQVSSSEGNSYSSSQLLAFLSAAKPGTMVAERTAGDTMRITLSPRYDLAVESRDPVVIDAVGDYHVGTSQDVILKDISVGGTLYVYAGRDVINQTATGVAGAIVGGLYIDAGRNVGSPNNPIQVTNDGVNPVTIHRIVAPGTANVTVLNGDVVIGELDVVGETNLVANNGNFSSLGAHAEFDGGLVNLRAVNALGQTSGHIGLPGQSFDVVQLSGSLGLFGLGAHVSAVQGDLSVADSELDGVVALTAQTGALGMASTTAVIRTTDDSTGQVDLSAATGIGSGAAPMRLDTGRFNAATPQGDVDLRILREAQADRVHALAGEARVVAEGDGLVGTTDLVIRDAQVARRLDLQAESMQASVRQTVQNTALGLSATGVDGLNADRVDLAVADAPDVQVSRLGARLATLDTDASRLNIVSGTITEEMNVWTRHVSGLMDNTTPALRYDRDFQYYIPWADFSLDLSGMGATGSRAPMWFDSARGVYTLSFVTAGYAAFDINRPNHHTELTLDTQQRVPAMRFTGLQVPADRIAAHLLVSEESVNLQEEDKP